ncbi:MAG TPA: hypothetical protein VM537_15180 [Anaerolineae bacterium]|nr:hypothetical protein [Anaerolineae bacterium]
MSEAFEIKVGTIGRLISCDNCVADHGKPEIWENEEVCPDCAHGTMRRKIVRVIEQYKHKELAMETPCFVVSSLDSETHIEGIRMWDLERISPLELLALQA